jgi:hypothetical protein
VAGAGRLHAPTAVPIAVEARIAAVIAVEARIAAVIAVGDPIGDLPTANGDLERLGRGVGCRTPAHHRPMTCALPSRRRDAIRSQ